MSEKEKEDVRGLMAFWNRIFEEAHNKSIKLISIRNKFTRQTKQQRNDFNNDADKFKNGFHAEGPGALEMDHEKGVGLLKVTAVIPQTKKKNFISQ